MRSTNFAVAIAATALLAGDVYAQGVCVNDVPNPYRLESSWAQLPGGRQWVGGNTIHVDHNGHVWAFDRCGRDGCKANAAMAPIFELTGSGMVLKNFGAGLVTEPHG